MEFCSIVEERKKLLIDICRKFGSPVYVYDAEKIVGNITILGKAFPSSSSSNRKFTVKIKYAMKALSNISILKVMKRHNVGIDAVSIEEVELAFIAGFSPAEIMFTPNMVAFEEIQRAIARKVHVNIDNLQMLEQFGKCYGNSQYPLCVRVNPHIAAGGNKNIQTGHIQSKFGISSTYLPQMMEIIERYNINIEGIHVHTGSDISDVDVFLKSAEYVFNIAKKFSNLKFLDFGSGFKVPYKPGDKQTDIATLGKRLGEAMNNFCEEYFKLHNRDHDHNDNDHNDNDGRKRHLELWIEPGKFLVSSSGILLAKVNVIKPTETTTFIGVDTGLNHLIRPMFYGSYHHIINISNNTTTTESGTNQPHPLKTYSIVGNICETDTFAWEREGIEETKVGDILAFLNAGAYGMSMASNYNSRFRPAEVLIIDNQTPPQLIRRRESLEDLIALQIKSSL